MFVNYVDSIKDLNYGLARIALVAQHSQYILNLVLPPHIEKPWAVSAVKRLSVVGVVSVMAEIILYKT